ncbi:hypothetical protein OS493_038438 [Desmophyllum pertusum]|uniref:Uncharacterized protein n=1 Tax=Desmophyllum pertusum TaxID=174260 RepID=A0A9X0CGX0_9CNID|nr:hypothetical protein OS493_038438 [Desmophyllum pertusum]
MPSQAVLELYEGLEIKPFLYRVPPESGKFRAFFEYLGCSKSARPTQYAMVLEMLPREMSECQTSPKRELFDTLNSQKKDFDEGVIANIERGLQSIQLCAVDSLKTALYYNGDFIPGSEAKKFYGELLGKNAVLIPEMLRCPLSDIWSLLDRTNIRQDDTHSAATMDIYPEPGTFIPIEDHHLLNDAFLEFEPGEYVGYQLDDPSPQLSEGAATYIYAVIIEEVEVIDEDDIVDEDNVVDLLTKMYMINIGHDKEPVQVNSAELYQLHRLQEISDEQHSRNREKQAVFDEISVVLEDAWKLPEEQRTQIVKRLILRWRPEKNLGDEEFCSEAFEHIKYEISRLGRSYDEYIDAWVARAREHGSHREEYRERSRGYGSWESSSSQRRRNFPPSFCRRNPQPGEARRWFRQAEADLYGWCK